MVMEGLSPPSILVKVAMIRDCCGVPSLRKKTSMAQACQLLGSRPQNFDQILLKIVVLDTWISNVLRLGSSSS
jgi:hypothetical protein